MRSYERQETVIRYIKLYLCSLFVFIHFLAFLDDGGPPPYFPIELSSLLLRHYTRKAIFLASLTPVTLLVCFTKEMSWCLQGMGMSLFLMVLFDAGNEWFLHLVAVAIFAFCVSSSIDERPLYNLVVFLYLLRMSVKLLYVWHYEMPHHFVKLIDRTKLIAIYGCSGYIQCQDAFITPYVFTFCALLQWLSFIILFYLIKK